MSRIPKPPQRHANPRQTFKLVFVAALLMIMTDFFFAPQLKLPREELAGPPAPQHGVYEHSEIEDYEFSARDDEGAYEKMGAVVIDIPPDRPETAGPRVIHIPQKSSEKAGPVQEQLDLKKSKAVAKIAREKARLKIEPGAPGKIVIIIDDMGMDRKRSYEAIGLPGPLTLAFLPYAPKLAEITGAAREQGHELLVHAPMQPMDKTMNPGPVALRESMTRGGFEETLNLMLASFEGYVGINNHMGSKLTQNVEAMQWVMEEMAKRNLIFVDSVTIQSSMAADTAEEFGVRHARRDVFLDNRNNKEFVLENLRHLESIARRRGYAVAIGHPKDGTIEALKEWMPGLKERNLTLVPVSTVAQKN